MRMRSYFYGLLACVALGACSNDEVAENPGNVSNGGDAYVKVKIMMPDGSMTRAGEDGGYENGSTSEQSITSINFGFYKADGTWVTEGKVIGQTDVTADPVDEATPDYREAIASAVVALELAEEAEKPALVIAYVNLPTGAWNNLKDKSIADVKKVTLADAANFAAQSNNFVMTNSTYVNTTEQIATAIAPSQFYETATMATNADPVDIYVERLAAKVKVTNNATSGTLTVDGDKNAEYTLTLTVNNWTLSGINTESYYLKKLNSTWITTAPWTGWNSSSEYRCFWAEDVNYDNTTTNKLTYRSYDTTTKTTSGKSLYCLENTLSEAAFDADNNDATFALILGEYSVKDKSGNDVQGNFYMTGGILYPETDIITRLANNGLIWKKTSDNPLTYERVDPTKTGDDIYEMVSAGDATKATLAIKSSITVGDYYYYDAKSEQTNKYVQITNDNLANVNELLATTVGTVDGYNGGKTYFAVPIEHLNWTTEEGKTVAGGDGAYGVVRNHIYELNITSITGLGTGVFDPAKEIIPDYKSKTYYLGGRLNILSWKKVTQNVIL